jgi:predicted metal-dependent hydrolase
MPSKPSKPSDPADTLPFDGPADSQPAGPVEVRRSARRRRTVSAYREGDRTIVLLPASMSRAQERHWVEVMVERLQARDRRQRPSDTELRSRAATLSARYLGGRAVPASVRWVSNQTGRWGSCTVDDRSIRLSSRLRGMPAYVIDYVLLHELTHLLVHGHGPAFWAELESYPMTERARGFLDGWATAQAGGDERRDSDLSDEGPADWSEALQSSDHQGDRAGDEGAY